MEDFELTYDVSRNIFIHEPTGYLLSGDYLMIEEEHIIKDKIHAATGVQVDDQFIFVLKDTVYTMSNTLV